MCRRPLHGLSFLREIHLTAKGRQVLKNGGRRRLRRTQEGLVQKNCCPLAQSETLCGAEYLLFARECDLILPVSLLFNPSLHKSLIVYQHRSVWLWSVTAQYHHPLRANPFPNPSHLDFHPNGICVPFSLPPNAAETINSAPISLILTMNILSQSEPQKTEIQATFHIAYSAYLAFSASLSMCVFKAIVMYFVSKANGKCIREIHL